LRMHPLSILIAQHSSLQIKHCEIDQLCHSQSNIHNISTNITNILATSEVPWNILIGDKIDIGVINVKVRVIYLY
jgi:hypothetical protein